MTAEVAVYTGHERGLDFLARCSDASSNKAQGAAPNRLAITVVVGLATLMQALDTTIANVSLRYIQGSLAANQDEVEWAMTSYIVAAAIMTPATGYLTRRFGLKRLFMVAIIGFTAGSMLCGMAISIGKIVVFRVIQCAVQGAFGAALVPLSQAVPMNTHPPERQGLAMAYWGMAIMIGPIAGPVIGGWLTFNYSWGWDSYSHLPIGILALIGMVAFLPETERTPAKLDWVLLRHVEYDRLRLADSARPLRGARLVRFPGNCGNRRS